MKRAVCSAIFASALLCPAKADDLYIRGLGEIFSVGICSIGAGECISFLSVENAISDFCARRPAMIRVAGHSMGASAAIRFVHGMAECGLAVQAAAFLDPMTHPYGIPDGTRTLVIYSTLFAGAGEGHDESRFALTPHVAMTFSKSIKDQVRALFYPVSITRKSKGPSK